MTKIQDVQNYLNENPEILNAVNEFKNQFTFLEMAYKNLLKSYLSTTNKVDKENDLRLNLNQIPAVLKFHKINISEDILNSIFSMKDKYIKRNTKSAKALRNAVTHEMTIQDLNEIYSRRNELSLKMKEFSEKLNKQIST